jgi:hypothetical protein
MLETTSIMTPQKSFIMLLKSEKLPDEQVI